MFSVLFCLWLILVTSKRKNLNAEQQVSKLSIFNSYSNFLVCICRERQAIEFYDLNNLQGPLQTYSVAPDHPGRLCTCTSSPGTLVYTNCYLGEQVVKWLDCDYYPPSPTNKKTKVLRKQASRYSIQDMCCVTFGNTNLLITTHSYGGVYAYVAGTDELKWYVGGYQNKIDKWMNAVGITSNGYGQLFVCDISNNCIQMISIDGTFLGTVLRSGAQGLGNPQRIRWCSKANYLVIAHEKQGLFSINVF